MTRELLLTARIVRVETKPLPSGEDHITKIHLEFSEPHGGSFPSRLDELLNRNGGEEDGTKITPLFKTFSLPWSNIEIPVRFTAEFNTKLNDVFVSFRSTIATLKAKEAWTDETGSVITYRMICNKQPDNTDQILSYLSGRKVVNTVTGKKEYSYQLFTIKPSSDKEE